MEEEFDYGFVDEQELMAMGTFIEEPEVFFYEEEILFEPIRVEESYFEPSIYRPILFVKKKYI